MDWKMTKRIFGLLLLAAAPLAGASSNLPLDQIHLPPGFHIEVYAAPVPNARSLTLSPNGTLFVGTRTEGSVYAIPTQGAGARRVITIARGLENPNGVAFRDGALYVMERSRLLRYDDIEHRLQNPPKPVVVRDDYPDKAHHGWKFVAFGPDGRLYIPVGAPCNNCLSKDPLFASITRLTPDGKERDIFAQGVRNTVGFDWHPETHVLWFTDNGRDELGDDVPDDELNAAPRTGLHFGFPYCHGRDVQDPEFGALKPCSAFTPPEALLGAHVAALGMRFYTGRMFPAPYHNNIFIAEHGSWNRTVPIGYRVVRVRLDGSRVLGTEVFAQGWLPPSASAENPNQPDTLRADESADTLRYKGAAKRPQAWGRPVDVQMLPDGSLLVSDDEAGVICRITYSLPNQNANGG
jgi:glucose/arabinose dehydrogenase